MDPAIFAASFASFTEPSLPGTMGTPAFFMAVRASSLLPMARMAAGVGPMNTSPASMQACAKLAFSARNP
jgi:hypothetical protein